jgi:hypothetical protein
MPTASSLGLPVRYRRQALAALDRMIAVVEADRAARCDALERQPTAGARLRLRLAEQRLALLARSRQWLLAGEPPDGQPSA